jgi:hypothetical protein
LWIDAQCSLFLNYTMVSQLPLSLVYLLLQIDYRCWIIKSSTIDSHSFLNPFYCLFNSLFYTFLGWFFFFFFFTPIITTSIYPSYYFSDSMSTNNARIYLRSKYYHELNSFWKLLGISTGKLSNIGKAMRERKNSL